MRRSEDDLPLVTTGHQDAKTPCQLSVQRTQVKEERVSKAKRIRRTIERGEREKYKAWTQTPSTQPSDLEPSMHVTVKAEAKNQASNRDPDDISI